VAPPARRAAESHQAGRLGRDAVHGDELLLLADGVEEAERVGAEADQPQRSERQQADGGAGKQAQALAPAGSGEHEERQQQPGAELDPDTGDERAGGSL
jgi:hypothetical protein